MFSTNQTHTLDSTTSKFHILLIHLIKVGTIVGIIMIRIRVGIHNEASNPQFSDFGHKLLKVLDGHI